MNVIYYSWTPPPKGETRKKNIGNIRGGKGKEQKKECEDGPLETHQVLRRRVASGFTEPKMRGGNNVIPPRFMYVCVSPWYLEETQQIVVTSIDFFFVEIDADVATRAQ